MNNELFVVYKTITAEIEALRAQAKECAMQLLHEATKTYFDKYDDVVEQIFWHQYTPWFNDGDTCEFSVGDVHVVLRDDADDDKYSEGSQFDDSIDEYKHALDLWRQFNADPEVYKDMINTNSGGSYFDNRWNLREHYKPYYISEQELNSRIDQFNSYPEGFVEDTNKLVSFISSIDKDQMEALFGNHVTVRLSIAGISVEEYRHE